MTKVFISHAKDPDAHVAEEIAYKLRAHGLEVFFDGHSLPSARDYDERISNEIASADLFVFLLRTSSVRPGRYTLTELKLARERWPTPNGRVLAVLLEPDMDLKMAPPYLTSVATIYRPEGAVATEVAREVARLLPRRPAMRRAWPWVALGLALITVAALVTFRRLGQQELRIPDLITTDSRLPGSSEVTDVRPTVSASEAPGQRAVDAAGGRPVRRTRAAPVAASPLDAGSGADATTVDAAGIAPPIATDDVVALEFMEQADGVSRPAGGLHSRVIGAFRGTGFRPRPDDAASGGQRARATLLVTSRVTTLEGTAALDHPVETKIVRLEVTIALELRDVGSGTILDGWESRAVVAHRSAQEAYAKAIGQLEAPLAAAVKMLLAQLRKVDH